ncbi:MAG: tetratricopeptide repeat protein [Chlorobium sp.]|nr:tetratricopeptide repeat protein [Chlorobium sp.]MCW8819162.1 tetratricopeptide repeat protein [Ignavibacteriaceae bacterium]
MLKDALGSYRGSLAELDRIIDEDPNNPEVYYDRANVRSGRGDIEGAIDDYSKAIELGLRLRERFLAYGNRGIARAALEDNQGALEDFTVIIEASPKNRGILRTALYNRAMLREKTGDIEGAAMDYQQRSGIITKSKTGE